MLHPRRPEEHRLRLARLGIHVDRRFTLLASRHRANEGDGAAQYIGHALDVGAPLEAVRRLCAGLERAARRPDPLGIEVRALQQHVAGLVRDLRVTASHHAGDRGGALAVADHRHLRRELALLAIQRDHLLALVRPPHDDPVAADLREVERVQRLVQLEQDVVRGVHDVVDGPLSDAAQSGLEPRWRGTDLHAPDHGAHVARAACHILDADLDAVDRAPLLHHARRRALRRGVRNRGELDRRSVGSPQLARDALVSQQVPPVRGHLQVHPRVGELHGLEQRRSRRGVRAHLHDALVLRAELQFPGRAQHPVGHDPPDLARLQLEPAGQHRAGGRVGILGSLAYVGGAANDLHDVLSGVHVAQREAVGVGMLLDLLDDADDDVIESGSHVLDRLHRRAEHRQPLGGIVGVQLAAQHGRQPVGGNEHGYCTNCERKRMSFSNSNRMSGMPCRSIVIRSIPIPNA